jgi:hypothetical protein
MPEALINSFQTNDIDRANKYLSCVNFNSNLHSGVFNTDEWFQRS